MFCTRDAGELRSEEDRVEVLSIGRSAAGTDATLRTPTKEALCGGVDGGLKIIEPLIHTYPYYDTCKIKNGEIKRKERGRT
jgi:hypothetical protein